MYVSCSPGYQTQVNSSFQLRIQNVSWTCQYRRQPKTQTASSLLHHSLGIRNSSLNFLLLSLLPKHWIKSLRKKMVRSMTMQPIQYSVWHGFLLSKTLIFVFYQSRASPLLSFPVMLGRQQCLWLLHFMKTVLLYNVCCMKAYQITASKRLMW